LCAGVALVTVMEQRHPSLWLMQPTMGTEREVAGAGEQTGDAGSVAGVLDADARARAGVFSAKTGDELLMLAGGEQVADSGVAGERVRPVEAAGDEAAEAGGGSDERGESGGDLNFC